MQRVAGNRLFHIVVRDEATAKACIDALRRANAGRLTFLPLDRMRSNLPDRKPANDPAVKDRPRPMMEMLTLQKPDWIVNGGEEMAEEKRALLRAVQSVWGRTYMAKDGDTAAKLAQEFSDIEFCTQQGDKARTALCRAAHDRAARSQADFCTMGQVHVWRLIH